MSATAFGIALIALGTSGFGMYAAARAESRIWLNWNAGLFTFNLTVCLVHLITR
jgi:hypothetical protein